MGDPTMQYHILLSAAVCLIGGLCAGMIRSEKSRLFWTEFAAALGLILPFFSLLPLSVELAGAITVLPAMGLGVCLVLFVKEINFTSKNSRDLLLILAFFVFSVGSGMAGGHTVSVAAGIVPLLRFGMAALSFGTLLWDRSFGKSLGRMVGAIFPLLCFLWLPPQSDRCTAILLSVASGALITAGYSLISDDSDRLGLLIGTVVGMGLCIL